jgi:dUTP pyrophosphatase
MKVKIKKLRTSAKLPVYGSDGAACFDLHAASIDGFFSPGPVDVTHSEPVIVGTGLAFEVPEGHVMLLFSRSGHGFNHSTRLGNCVGIIDSDYRSEVKVSLVRDGARSGMLKVDIGDRIAQGMVLPVERVGFELVEELTETVRGAGGFGSTGK